MLVLRDCLAAVGLRSIYARVCACLCLLLLALSLLLCSAWFAEVLTV